MEKVLKNLGYRKQSDILLINAPDELRAELLPLFAAEPISEAEGRHSFILFFAGSLSEVEKAREGLVKALEPEGRLWICYPKRSGKIKSDLSRDVLWGAFAEFGMEPVSNFSVNETWSALRYRPVDEIPSLKRKSAATEKGRERIGQ